MIDELSIMGFKRFKSVTIPFRPLTVLTGLNGTGKSTVIQAMILCRQVAENPATNVVRLNGHYVSIANEVRPKSTSSARRHSSLISGAISSLSRT